MQNFNRERPIEGDLSRCAYVSFCSQSRLTAITYGGTNYAGGSGASQTAFAWEIDSDLDSLIHRFSGSTDVSFDFGYDASGKLISESASDASWLYIPDGPRTDTYSAVNNLNQYSSVNGFTVSHDLNGNRTSYDGLDTPHDSENRLTGIGSNLTYRYDANGRRTGKTSSSGTTQFVHAGDMEIAEYSSGTLEHRYIPGHSVDQRVAWQNVSSGATHYYHANRLGSVQAVTNAATGAVTDQYVYTPFGIESPIDTTGNPFRYTGRRLDPESGLYHYRARYYDPSLGRFLETDPIGYQDQMNMYAYIGNDPLNATDPSGLEKVCANEGRRRHCVETGEELSLTEKTAIEREYRGFILDNPRGDVSRTGRRVSNISDDANDEDIKKTRIASKFFGAAVKKYGDEPLKEAWKEIKHINVINAVDRGGYDVGFAHIDPTRGTFQQIDITAQIGRWSLSRASFSTLSTSIAHETLHFDKRYNWFMGATFEGNDHLLMHGHAQFFNMSSGLGTCGRAGIYPACGSPLKREFAK